MATSRHAPFGSRLSLATGDIDVLSIKSMSPYAKNNSIVVNPSNSGIEYYDLSVKIVKARYLIATHAQGVSDPYVIITSSRTKPIRSTTKYSTTDPIWNESFEFKISSEECYLTLEIWDSDQFSGDDFMGKVIVPISLYAMPAAEWFPIGRAAAADVVSGEIFLEICVAKEYFISARWGDILENELLKSIKKFKFDTPIDDNWKLKEYLSNKSLEESNKTHIPDMGKSTSELKLNIEPVSKKDIDSTKFSLALNDDKNNRMPNSNYATPLNSPSFSLSTSAEFVTNNQYQLTLPFGERMELCLKNSVLSLSGFAVYGRLYITNYRVCFLPEELFNSQNFSPSKLSCILVPFAALRNIERALEEKIIRTKAMVMTIHCANFQCLKFIFALSEHSETLLLSVYRRIQFEIRNSNYSAYSMCKVSSAALIPNLESEYNRMLFNSEKYRITNRNSNYELCNSYPSKCLVPTQIDDEMLEKICKFRSQGRFPVATYFYPRGNVLVRCSQPMPGLTNNWCKEDEYLIEQYRINTPNDSCFMIFDARSASAAGGNKITGKGTEDMTRYQSCRLRFLDIANIHAMRYSIDALYNLVNAVNVPDEKWMSELEKTSWLEYIRSILNGANIIASQVVAGFSTMVHCSDGWDRTSQLTSLVQVLIDGYYRTIDGFINLVEKEWLAFGHRFASRNFDVSLPNERSPVFLQFLDCVWQIMKQFPESFEFNENFLISIYDHLLSSWFGTFMFDCESDRKYNDIYKSTYPVWSFLTNEVRLLMINKNYNSLQKVMKRTSIGVKNDQNCLYPICSLKVLSFWTNLYLRYDEIMLRNHLLSEEKDEPTSHQKFVLWMPDASATECMACNMSFSFFRRRHHCRRCGALFCYSCISGTVDLPELGYTTPQKVCEKCFSLQNSEFEEIAQPSPKAIHPNLVHVLSTPSISRSSPTYNQSAFSVPKSPPVFNSRIKQRLHTSSVDIDNVAI